MSSIKNFLAARTNQEKAIAIDNLEAKYSFDLTDKENITHSNEWDKDTQIATIERYLESHQEYLNRSKKVFYTNLDGVIEYADLDHSFCYHSMMTLLVQQIGGDLSKIIDRAIFLALYDNSEVKGCGSTLLLRASSYLSSYFPEILQIMSKHGLWERPFKVGKVFNQILDRNPELIDEVVSKLDSLEDENLITSVLFALSERQSIPDVFDRHITKYVKHGTGETKSIALIAVGAKPKLAKTLEDDIWSSLISEECFIRRNAVNVCGNAQLNPSRFLPKLVEMLTGFVGNDRPLAKGVVSAIAKYGEQAIFALPAIKNAMSQWIEKEYGEEDDEFIERCQNTITYLNSFQSSS